MDRESAYEEYRRKRAEKRKRRKINMLKRRCFFFSVLIVLGVSIYAMYTAEIFNVDEINCTGNSIITTEELLEKSGLRLGDNLFLSSVKRAEKNLGKMPYVETHKVWRTLPNKINIKITETVPIAYIGTDKNLWVVDKNGKLLENVEEIDTERCIPYITGISVENYEVNDVLRYNGNKALSDGLKCAEILEKFDLLSKTTKIDVANSEDIKISYDNRLYMYMGSFDTFEYKMGIIKKIFEEKKITDYEHAVLNYRTDKLYVGNEDMFAEDNSVEEETENSETDETDADSENSGESSKEKSSNEETEKDDSKSEKKEKSDDKVPESTDVVDKNSDDEKSDEDSEMKKDKKTDEKSSDKNSGEKEEVKSDKTSDNNE